MNQLKSKNKNKNTGKQEIVGLDLTYNGPMIVPKGPSQVRTLKVNKSFANNYISQGSGIMIGSFSTADVVNCTDWASQQAVWREYRVLGIECIFIPIAGTTATPIVMAVVGDHNSALTALTSMNDAVSYDNVKFITGGAGCNITSGKYPKYVMKASGVEELGFINITSAPTTQIYGIKTYSTVGSVTTVYYEVIETFLIEFRGSN